MAGDPVVLPHVVHDVIPDGLDEKKGADTEFSACFANADIPWKLRMATTIRALVPPVLGVIAIQKLFVKGLIEAEK